MESLKNAIGAAAVTHIPASPRRSPLLRAVVLAPVIGLIPLATAFAQSIPLVRVSRAETPIVSGLHLQDPVITKAPRGTLLEVIYTDGDLYRHDESNWYWVLLPRDPWGTKRAGWVSARHVEHVPPAEPVKPALSPQLGAVEMPRVQAPSNAPDPAAESVPSALAASASAPSNAAAEAPGISEVVLHFKFAKSDLTDEARAKLDSAVAALKVNPLAVSFALEGHADATGPEAFNDRLGQARADAVKRYLADVHEIPIEKISVVSYGEHQPAAPNSTRDGRAQNRRVVIKVGL